MPTPFSAMLAVAHQHQHFRFMRHACESEKLPLAMAQLRPRSLSGVSYLRSATEEGSACTTASALSAAARDGRIAKRAILSRTDAATIGKPEVTTPMRLADIVRLSTSMIHAVEKNLPCDTS